MAFVFAQLLFVVSFATQPTVINLTSADIQTKIAAQICSGLSNRDPQSNGVYTLMNEPYDTEWLQDLYQIDNPIVTPIHDFMFHCLSTVAKGYIRFNYTVQHQLTPNLITLASMLDAVLLQDDSPYAANTTLLLDALTEFKEFSALDTTKYMYTRYVNQTTTLSFMDPTPLNPGLIDYIIKEKLFNFYLNDACIRFTPEYNFVLEMVTPANNPWNNPINVMGYNTAWAVAGDLFEAETDCNSLHNMGQIASSGFNNLAFLSRTAPIDKPLAQNPSTFIKFNQSKIYISFTIGDGDNLSYLKTSRRDWMKDRFNKCQQSNFSYEGCFPLQWSISPHPLYLAPDMLRWYYKQSYKSKNDYFVLPPSGHLYAYPSEMDYDTAQRNFVAATEQDCRMLSCNATVAWEFVFHWDKAIKTYFPRYGGKDQSIYGFFAVNVPYNVPVADFWRPLEFYKILAESVVVFKPREWRGTNHTTCTGGVPLSGEDCLTPEQMALEINRYPRSTITQVYVTSDGGGNLQMIYDLVPKLNEYVQVVTPTQLIELALQAK